MTLIKRLALSIRFDIIQLSILTKHFFHRLFQNDLVDFEDQMRESLIAILSILSVFSGFLTFALLNKYNWVPDQGTSWVEKCVLITWFMIVTGCVAVLQWDNLFLDNRDYGNLSQLPIKVRTIFFAKFISVFLYVGLFAIGMNVFSTLIVWSILPQWQSPSLIFSAYYIFTHLLATFFACLFAFFINLFLLGFLMLILGHRIFKAISLFVRSSFLIFHALLVILYFRLFQAGPADLATLSKIMNTGTVHDIFRKYFPPLWFTDLYETLLGNSNSIYHGKMRFALLGLSILFISFFIITGFGYIRHFRTIHAAHKKSKIIESMKQYIMMTFDSIFLRNQTQRAVFHFYRNTYRTSMVHKMRMAMYVAIASGFIIITLLPYLDDYSSLTPKSPTIISIQLVLSFFIVIGVRGNVNIPVSLQANWVFQLTENPSQKHYYYGVKKGIFFLNLIPIYAGLFLLHLFLWDGLSASYHCMYGLTISFLMIEIMFFSYSKIPFACSYLPGKGKLQLYWLIYIAVFFVYLGFFTLIEKLLLETPRYFTLFYGIVVLIVIVAKLYQNKFIYNKLGIKYEEIPEPVLTSLDL